MNDVLARAAALKEILASDTSSKGTQMVGEAVISCSRELVNAGEPALALELIAGCRVITDVDADWRFRLDTVTARVLHAAGDYKRSFRMASELLSGAESQSHRFYNETCELRILEASNLWILNRPDDAAERLLAVRSDLLCRPDSLLLAYCANQLACAESVRGNLREARRFALEAIVSARRSGNLFFEAQA